MTEPDAFEAYRQATINAHATAAVLNRLAALEEAFFDKAWGDLEAPATVGLAIRHVRELLESLPPQTKE